MDAEPKHRDAADKLIVLADLHMVPDGGTIIGIDPHARLAAAVRHINRHHADARRVIVLGDLAHGGDAPSYGRARALLSGLAAPTSLMIGNHDHRPTFLEAWPGATADADGFVQMQHQVGRWRLLLLDTVLDAPHAFPHDCGHLCDRRLAWLDRQLGEAAAERVLLFMHHPPMRTGFAGMDATRLVNAGALLEVLRRHGNVRHLFAGHIHRTIGGSWHGIPFSIFKSPVHQQPMDLVSASTSLSVDEPAAIGIVLLTGDGVVVHTEDYELSAAATA
jgi:3',5'-cyclic AMP phosphodiesterase CpdA